MAGDYVMGLLDETEQAVAERHIGTEQSFAKAVSAWRERLADLDLTAAETAPSPALWQRIAEAAKIAPNDGLPPHSPRCMAPRYGTTSGSGAPSASVGHSPLAFCDHRDRRAGRRRARFVMTSSPSPSASRYTSRYW